MRNALHIKKKKIGKEIASTRLKELCTVLICIFGQQKRIEET